MKDRVTSMKEEELSSISVIEPLLVSHESIVVIEEEELLSYFSSHSENEEVILSLRAVVGAYSQIPKGSFEERVEDILSISETYSALQKEHTTST
jgi:hypothetical protein